MTRRLLLGSLALAAGCGQSPLLKIAGTNYAPAMSLGTKWNYVTAAGAPAFERRLVGSGPFSGRQAFQIDTLVGGLTLTAQESHSGAAIDRYNATAGDWETVRKLPYITGNRWDLFGTATVSSRVYVEGRENVVVPAGTYVLCYRLRTETKIYNPGTGLTATTQALAWAAPVVGDVQYGSLADDGTVTVTTQLASYSPGP